jgi:hypothetical protein
MVNKDPRNANKRQKTEEEENLFEPDTKEETKDEPWLYKGVIVKVMDRSLGGGKFYKHKGKVYKVVDPKGKDSTEETFGYQGNVKMITGPAKDLKIQIDQIHLEPSIPEKVNCEVLILKGIYKGKLATLAELDLETQSGIMRLPSSEEALKLQFD